MLYRARAIPVTNGLPILWQEGDATTLPFPDASFDLVCCNQGLLPRCASSSHHAATLIAASYYYERDYAAAVEAAHRSLADYPTFPAPCRFLIAALAQLGHLDEAATASRTWTIAAPVVFETVVKARPVYMRFEDHEHLLEGLHRAGWEG